jgi:hypothetical protein
MCILALVNGCETARQRGLADTARPAIAIVEGMQNRQAVLSTFQFKRTADVIRVFNENSYLMAEYSERTGTVKWQRVLIASQREVIEKWLRERYPASAAVAAAPQVAPPPPPAAPVQRPRPPAARGTSKRRGS